ncbi:MAG: 1-deoxy-D-xylulose-5-phosphate reductoisomerase [Elusimicrobiota bacterium]
MSTKKIVILGSTGSIGVNALNVISTLPKDKYKIIALTAQRNIALLEQQVKTYHPEYAGVTNPQLAKVLEEKVRKAGLHTRVLTGNDALEQVATLNEANFVLISVVGAVGLRPLVAALKAGKTVALANKEPIVTAGEIVMSLVKKMGTRLLPVDSEHSAIFQCIDGTPRENIRKIVLTASGGPFYKYSKKDLQKVTVEDTLKHPSWKMGRKITVDSATLMNKGFEIIEARYLFDMPLEKLGIVVHPQSIVHSMVEFIDGNTAGIFSVPDMRLPIQYALTYPARVDTGLPAIDWSKPKAFEFYPIDSNRFPCLALALEALKAGGTMPTVLNAANEVAVEAFLKHVINFQEISKIISIVLEKHKPVRKPDLETIEFYDKHTRTETERVISKC